ncbi:hypothetical protein ACFW04_014463 [Cataglyphis niger]
MVRLDCRIGLNPRPPVTLEGIRRELRRRHSDGFAGNTLAPSPRDGNPADCASRGISPRKLVSHPLWWKGPS